MAGPPTDTASQTVDRAYTELFRNPARREALFALLHGGQPLQACPDDVSHVAYRLQGMHNEQVRDLFLSTWATSTAEARFKHGLFQPSTVAASHIFHAEIARETVDIMEHFHRSNHRRHQLEEASHREVQGKHLETILVVAFALVHPQAQALKSADIDLQTSVEAMANHYLRNDVASMLHQMGNLNSTNAQRGQKVVEHFIAELATMRVPKPLVLVGFDAVRNDTNLQHSHKAQFDFLRSYYEELLREETRDTRTRILALLKRATTLLERHKPTPSVEVKAAANESVILGRLSQMAKQDVKGKSFKR